LRRKPKERKDMNKTVIYWINPEGKPRRKALHKATEDYARNWWCENIVFSLGIKEPVSFSSKPSLLRLVKILPFDVFAPQQIAEMDMKWKNYDPMSTIELIWPTPNK
jgi:hypothetical protein